MNISSDPIFELFWLRETGCDAGTPMSAGELPPSIRQRVLELTQSDSLAAAPSTFQLRLPFLDRKEERQQDELLAALTYEREGTLIRAVLPHASATRDMAATCALADPLWRSGPSERDLAYFPRWQRVSMALQRWLRDHIVEEYFRDPARLEDRPDCYPMIVYQACRPFFGRPRTEFTYDLRDFPWCEDTLASSWKLTGRGLQRVLAGLEERIRALGNEQLARRYSPVWFEDVLVAVQRRPKLYADLLAREAAIINAVIDLGTQPKVDSVNRSAKIVNQQLRKVHSLEMRSLGCGIFEEATRVLAQQAAGSENSALEAWSLENADMRTSGSPDLRIAC
ncbi:MAG: hypothetical protein ABIR70_19085 [Bryobacteraceae bacterium]